MGRIDLSSLARMAAVLVVGTLASSCGSEYVAPKEVAEAMHQLPASVDYNWDVRPILSQNCFNCHGNSIRKAGLRLDQAETAYAELPESPGHHAIVPGKPEASELIRRITSTDPDFRMPPKDTHKTLSATQVATLIQWIKGGATYREHWAYLPPAVVEPAKTPFDARAINPIDRYIFATLQAKGMQPSPMADKETLINRVTLTLTGLPPTLEEVDAFVADTRPEAYEALVDRLLKSDAYAERMAQTWLDVARYADTDGYLNDGGGRLLHPYRDWVIGAFRRNLPYDKFATWQLAGDQLPDAKREQILATSFLRMGKRNAEGGITDEEWRVEYVNERAELVGTAFMGLTVGCAKCHDHKYDVISQSDYYSVAGLFNNLDEGGVHVNGPGGTPMGPTLAWPTPRQSQELAMLHAASQVQAAAFAKAREASRHAAAGTAEALAKQPADIAARLKASLDAGLEAYYPLESTYKASFEPLMIGPPPGQGGGEDPPAGRRPPPPSPAPAAAPAAARDPASPPPERLANADLSRAVGRAMREGRYVFDNPIAITQRRLLVGLDEKVLGWTPSGREGDPPGALNNATFIDGAKGKGVKLYDTIGFAAKGVGAYDRYQDFSLDLWIKLRKGEPYKRASVLYNQSRSGYDLLLEDNHLKFEVVHNPPFNMLSVRALEQLPQGKWVHVTVTYDGSSRASGVGLYVNGERVKAEMYRDNLTRTSMPRESHSLLGSYFGLAFGPRRGQQEFQDGAIDEIRVFRKGLSPLEVAWLHDPEAIQRKSAAALQAGLVDFLASQDEQYLSARTTLREALLAESRVESRIPQLMVAKDAPVPRPNYVLDRGIYDKYLRPTPADVPRRVFKYDGKPVRTRLDLTRYLFDEKNPLTARVYVNRLWQLQFGTGIVGTVQDFGTQGTNPTHPELLDWLAVEFRKSGWDIAHMQKLIVMSATYRQASTVSAVQLEQDPVNRWLGRGPRYRLPAEMIRDAALRAGGLLVNRVGGDAVFPYQPDGVWEGNGLGANIYPEAQDVTPDHYHQRSMYTYIKRNAQAPSLQIFDMADRNVATVARTISNTPLQALVLLNDPQYLEAYRKMGERALSGSTDPRGQVDLLFRLATRRHPQPSELDALLSYRQAEVDRLAKTKSEVDKLLKVGVSPVATKLDRVQIAGLMMVAAAAMNSPDAYTLH
jgi:hypothetical protein